MALDFPSAKMAIEFVEKLDTQTCALKVGYQLFVAEGPALIEKLVRRGFDIFLDLKFHDIPNTVAQACVTAAHLGVWMINVHACGGQPMMVAAREAIDKCNIVRIPYLIAVTVLTSMDQKTLTSIGVERQVPDVVHQWASMAEQSGLDGVVCSAQEAAIIRRHCQPEFMIVTPGIRMPANEHDDQHRVVGPSDARRFGATHIVVGRPITQAEDPSAALELFQGAFSSAQ